MKISILFLLICAVMGVKSLTAPYLSFMGETLPNHGFVDPSLIGDAASGGDSVECHTDFNSCCNSSSSGDWFTPNGTTIPFIDSEGDIYVVPGDRKIDLHPRNNNISAGIYRCDIETVASMNSKDNTTTRTAVYVGLYANGGDLRIVGGMTITLSRRKGMPQSTFTCVSTGGPATYVTWIRNTALAQGRKKSALDDPVIAQYTHTLTLNGRLEGRYMCVVTNDKPSRADAVFDVKDDLLHISVISQSSTTSNISWSLTDGVTATSYAISYANTNNTQCFFDSDDITGITENMYTLTGLQEGTEYSVTVTATLSNRMTFKKNILITTASAAPSAAPSPLSVSKVTSTAITVQWGAIDCVHHNGDTMGYSVQYGEVGSESMQTVNLTGNETTISGLTSLTAYAIRVAVVNSVSVGPYIKIQAETDGITLLVIISSISNTSITLSFALIEDHLNVTNYTISYSNTNNECFSESDDITGIPGSETMYTLTGLQEGTVYSMTVIGYLSNGESVTRSKVNSTMPSAPSAPPNLVGVSKVISTSITLQWGEVDCIHRNGDITGYTVSYREVGRENKTQAENVTGDVTQTTISGLVPNTLYHIQVAAVNSAGEGVSSEVSSYTPLIADDECPTSSPEDSCTITAAVVMSGSIGFIAGVNVTLLVTFLVFVSLCRRKAKTITDEEVYVDMAECKHEVGLTKNEAYDVASTPRKNSYQEEPIYEHME